jgi:hypothetical protein
MPPQISTIPANTVKCRWPASSSLDAKTPMMSVRKSWKEPIQEMVLCERCGKREM